jgi:SAM-dependent methyltransferase
MRDMTARVHPAQAAYVKDPRLNLFRRDGFENLPYSDGADAESRIAEIVGLARDRGTFSEELQRAIVDWPSEYHLSRDRHCIVRPLGIKSSERVLEIGCGCGAVTRYLGEIGASVTAIEGARQRARIAAERCRDLPNVAVFAENIFSFETAERFDWVLLVGVLEYAPVFSDAADPVGEMLRMAVQFLAPNGRLAVAIENKLGLKYFAGCAEDHVGTPFYGVQGLYGAGMPRTFGRDELGRLIHDAGLPHAAFLYPFPDYKLPRTILYEAAMDDPQFDAGDALARLQSRDYWGNPNRLFNEALVAGEVARNGLLGALSNSFLVIASRKVLPADDTLALVFATQRNPEFAVMTRFVRRGGRILVEKSRLCPGPAPQRRFADGSVLRHATGQARYVPGQLALRALSVARARHGDLAAIVDGLLPWFDFLLASATSDGRRLADLVLPGNYIDATPFNTVETALALVPIDREWYVDGDIALGWVVTRSVVHALWGLAGFEQSAVAIADVIVALCVERGLAVSQDEIAVWLDRESEFLALSTGRTLPTCSGGLRSRALVPPEHLTESDAKVAMLTRSVETLQTRLDLIQQSRSWRCTHPLRSVSTFLRRISRPIVPAHREPGGKNKKMLAVRERVLAMPRPLRRYGVTVAVLLAAFMLGHVAIAHGVWLPRMPLYLATIAVVARFAGVGPAMLALAGSTLAIVLSAATRHHPNEAALIERLGVFLICAAIGILLSIPHKGEPAFRLPPLAKPSHDT